MCQTDNPEQKQLIALDKECKLLKEEVNRLIKKLKAIEKQNISEDQLKIDEDKLKFYTGNACVIPMFLYLYTYRIS